MDNNSGQEMKGFTEVFSKLKLPASIRNAFAGAYVERPLINSERRAMELRIRSINIIGEKALNDLKQALENEFEGFSSIKINMAYDVEIDDKDAIPTEYWEDISYYIGCNSPFCNFFLKEADISSKDRCIKIGLSNNGSEYLVKRVSEV